MFAYRLLGMGYVTPQFPGFQNQFHVLATKKKPRRNLWTFGCRTCSLFQLTSPKVTLAVRSSISISWRNGSYNLFLGLQWNIICMVCCKNYVTPKNSAGDGRNPLIISSKIDTTDMWFRPATVSVFCHCAMFTCYTLRVVRNYIFKLKRDEWRELSWW
jgi:hypothetical protein